MKVMTHNRSVNWPAAICCKYKIPAMRWPTGTALVRLPKAVISQRLDD